MKFLIKISIIFQLQILSIVANQELDKINEVLNKFPEVTLPFKFSDGFENNNTNSKNDYFNNDDTLNSESIILLFNKIYTDFGDIEFNKFHPIAKIIHKDFTILIIHEECPAGGLCDVFYLTIINNEKNKIYTFFIGAAGADNSGIWTFSGEINKNLLLKIQNKEYKTIEKSKVEFNKLVKKETTIYKIDPENGLLRLIKK